MRGENPVSFPLRFFPFPGSIPNMPGPYPGLTPNGVAIADADKDFIRRLPIIPLVTRGQTLAATQDALATLSGSMGGLNYIAVERLVAAGNFVVPPVATTREAGEAEEPLRSSSTALERSRADALGLHFRRETVGGELKYTPRAGITSGSLTWLADNRIGEFSQKFEFFLATARKAEGVVFAYMRYVNSGAIPLALVLEANGYTPYGRKSRLLGAPIQSPGGRQCALCPLRERTHDAADHAFRPAFYALVTGDKELGAKNVDIINAERSLENKNGEIIKIVVGSQVAAEGVDFKYIREVHVMDSWYHLNRIEQIIGRGIRFCSHSALEPSKRNTTIFLYASVLPSELNRESGDLYSYRVAFLKGQQVGRVSRVMKQYAVDCNLNRDAIIIKDTDEIMQIDSQRNPRAKVPIRDMDYTAICDWLECDYKCIPEVDVRVQESEDTTYDAFTARWRVAELKKRMRAIFTRQNFYRTEDIRGLFADVPEIAFLNLLREVINNRSFKVIGKGGHEGYIRYCNKYYVFQPYSYTDIRIPLAIRSAKYPVKRDEYTPRQIEAARVGVRIADKVPLPAPGVEESKTETIVGPLAPGSGPAPASISLPVPEFNYITPWNTLRTWVHDLIGGASESIESADGSFAEAAIPKEIREDWVQHIAQNITPVIVKLGYILQVVVDFVKRWRASGARDPELTEEIILNFFWDNWLIYQEQLDAVYRNLPGATDQMGASIYKFGTLDVLRVLNPNDGEILYYCRDRKPCVRSIRDDILRDKTHPSMEISKVSQEGSGFYYGFLAPKSGSLVFKTNTPPKEGQKRGMVGAECGNVSTTREHIKKIDTLFAEIREHHAGIWSRSGANLQNATRVCTFLELLLRWMNRQRLGGKIWFYRPVQAALAGHKGLFRESAAKASAAI